MKVERPWVVWPSGVISGRGGGRQGNQAQGWPYNSLAFSCSRGARLFFLPNRTVRETAKSGMSSMASLQLSLGNRLPAFSLVDTIQRQPVSSRFYVGRPLLIAVICNHCPYVVHIKEGLALLGQKLRNKGVHTLAVSANDPRISPIDAPEKMALDAQIYGYEFPYAFDAEQSLVRALRAVCTPEFFLFDAKARLVYRGQMDDARPNNDEPNDGHDILAATSAFLAGAPPLDLQKPASGCSIRWRENISPDYLRDTQRYCANAS